MIPRNIRKIISVKKNICGIDWTNNSRCFIVLIIIKTEKFPIIKNVMNSARISMPTIESKKAIYIKASPDISKTIAV